MTHGSDAPHSPNQLPAVLSPSGNEPATAMSQRRLGSWPGGAAAQGNTGENVDDEIDLRQIWRTLLKHRAMIAGVTGVCVLVAALYTLRTTPQYKAVALLQIDRAAQKVVGFGVEMQVDELPASEQLQLRTQIELLNSRSLAELVIDELGLDHSRSRQGAPASQPEAPPPAAAGEPGESPVPTGQSDEPGWFSRLGSNLGHLLTPASDDKALLDREGTINAFQRAVTINPVRNSRLVEIEVLDPDPEQAARVANTMARAFIATNLERKTDSTQYARQYLQDQIAQTKAKVEESERLINQYAKANEILNLGNAGNATTQKFVEFSGALAKAEQERIRAQTQYNEVKNAPETAPRVLENVAVQRYKEEKARHEAEYAKNLEVYKPDFPNMLQTQAQIERLQARIDAEVGTILASIQGQYEAALEQENMLRQRVEDSRQDVLTMQDRSVDLNLLRRDLDTNRQVYDSLLQRLKELSVTADITTNNISIADPARAALFPAKPRPAINLGLGLVMGLFLGILAALLREQLDDTLKHVDEVEATLGLPLLGLIPLTSVPKGMSSLSLARLAQTEPRGKFAEAYRSMRTALQFSTVNGAPKRLLLTSCGKGEGKTTTAIALAINFAQLGQKVLLIDADMRRPTVHKALLLPNERGLSNLLSGAVSGELPVRPTGVEHLDVLTAGPTPPDPVGLLMGARLGALLEEAERLGYAHVVVDGPPLLGIADAVVLANKIQHVVFVVKAAAAKKASIRDSLRRMGHAGVAPLGVAMTHVQEEHTSYYGYQNYYGYGPGAPAVEAQMAVPPALAQGQRDQAA